MIKINAHSPFSKKSSFFDDFTKTHIEIDKNSFNLIENKINWIFNLINEEDNFSNILIYGQVQSGKTLFFTSLIVKFIEKYNNPIIIILSNNNTKLLEQTFNRVKKEFNQLNKFYNMYNYTHYKNMQKMENSNDPQFFFCLKNTYHLEQIIRILKINIEPLNIIIIDDESDIASISNDKKAIAELMDKLLSLSNVHKIRFFPITATPFDNISINDNQISKPKFVIGLDINDSYYGIKKFVSQINDYNFNNIKLSSTQNNETFKNNCLFNAVVNFLGKISTSKDHKPLMLINSEHQIDEQETLCKWIENIIKNNDNDWTISDDLRNYLNENKKYILGTINNSIDSIKNENKFTLDEYDNSFSQIVIGHNKVSRGVTFKGLSCTYMFGNPNITISTLLQQARWFGYRKNINDIEIYLPEYFIDYYIVIEGLVNYQFYQLKNNKYMSSNQLNELINNFILPINLEYSRFYKCSNNNKKIWNNNQLDSYTNINDYDLDLLSKSLENKFPWYIENNNKVYSLGSLSNLLKNINNDEKVKLINFLTNKTSFYFNKSNDNEIINKNLEKNIFIRFINFNENDNKLIPYKRKILNKHLFFDNSDRISIHGYNDEYNDKYFNSILIDIVSFKTWKYQGDKKTKQDFLTKIILRIDN